MLRKIECFLQPGKLEPVRDMLINKGVEGMSVIEAQGFGTRSKLDKKGKPILEKRVKVEIVLDESRVEEILSELKSLAGDGEIGMGKAFVIPVEDAVRLATREVGKSAIF